MKLTDDINIKFDKFFNISKLFFKIDDRRSRRWRRRSRRRLSFDLTRSPVGEDDRKKDKSVHSSDQNDAEVHPEIEDAENLRIGKHQNDDSEKVGDVNSWEKNVPEFDDRLVRAFDLGLLRADGVGAQDVAGELDADAAGHDEVDQRNCVEGDVPPEHEAEQVDDDEDDDEDGHDGRLQVESAEDESDCENWSERNRQRSDRVLDHGQVLLVEDVEDWVGEDVDAVKGVVAIDHRRQVVGQTSRPPHGFVVIFRRFENGVEGKKAAGRHAGDVWGRIDHHGSHPDTVSICCVSSLWTVFSWIVLQEPGQVLVEVRLSRPRLTSGFARLAPFTRTRVGGGIVVAVIAAEVAIIVTC